MSDIATKYGALLLGSFVGMILSGVLFAQVVSYFKTYHKDTRAIKSLVLVIWLLDILHSVFIGATVWDYSVTHFGSLDSFDDVPWVFATTIIITAFLTLLVHSFFMFRIYRLSKHNLRITGLIAFLILARLCFGCATTGKLLVLGKFHLFDKKFRWLFTLGLSASLIVDILITASLFHYLGMGRTISSALDAVIDSVLIYTLENGALTCAATVSCTVCWLAMPHNLVFMGIYFVISKLYANSLLTALNTREHIRRISVASSAKTNNLYMSQRNAVKERSGLTMPSLPWNARESSVITKESVRASHDDFEVKVDPVPPTLPQFQFGINTRNQWPQADEHPPTSVRVVTPDVTRLEVTSFDCGQSRDGFEIEDREERLSGPIFPSLCSDEDASYTLSPGARSEFVTSGDDPFRDSKDDKILG